VDDDRARQLQAEGRAVDPTSVETEEKPKRGRPRKDKAQVDRQVSDVGPAEYKDE